MKLIMNFHSLKNKIMKNRIILILIPSLTFLLGFFTFVSLSILYNVFWIDSEYDVPLILNISVMIGDSILLPIVNYMVFNLYFNKLSMTKPNIKLYLWIILSFVISLLINIQAHNSWVNDRFTDFVSFQPGIYSIIGIWHLAFSVIETVILLLLPFLWVKSILTKNSSAIKYSRKTWVLFFLFTLLSSLDMLNKYYFVYETTLSQTIKNEGFPFTTSIMALILLITMSIIERRKATHNSTYAQ